MSDPVPSSPRHADGPVHGRGVLCVKCEHLNPAALDKCETCDAHLFVVCSRCGHRNGRVLSRYGACRGKLHRSVRERWKGGSEAQPVNLLYFGLGIIGIGLMAAFFLWLADIRLPRLW